MEKFVEQGYLYDFYGELLTERQQQVYESVVLEDYSLSEVAEDLGISRQGVHDMIKRCNKTLEEYEQKLHLVEKFLNIRAQVKQIRVLAREYHSDEIVNISNMNSFIEAQLSSKNKEVDFKGIHNVVDLKLNGRNIIKEIYVKNKIYNIVVK